MKNTLLFHQLRRRKSEVIIWLSQNISWVIIQPILKSTTVISYGKLLHWSITLFSKLDSKTSLFTLSLYNFIEFLLVFVHCALKKQSPHIPSNPFKIFKTSNISAQTLLVSNMLSPKVLAFHCMIYLYIPKSSWLPSCTSSIVVSIYLKPNEAS